MGIRTELTQQAGVKPHIMNILLRHGAGVEIQAYLPDAVHARGDVDPPDAVLSGRIRDFIGPDFLREIGYRDRLQGGHQRGIVLLLLRGAGFIHDPLNFLRGHAGLDPGKPVGELRIQLFLFARSGVSGNERIESGIQHPFADERGETAVGGLFPDVAVSLQGFLVVKGVSGNGVSVRDGVDHPFDGVGGLAGELVGQLKLRGQGVHKRVLESGFHDGAQTVIDGGTEELSVFRIDVHRREGDRVVRSGQLAPYAEGSRRKRLLQILHQRGAAAAQQAAQTVHGSFGFHAVLHAGAQNIVDNRGMVFCVRPFDDGVRDAFRHRRGNPPVGGFIPDEFTLLKPGELFVQQLQEIGPARLSYGNYLGNAVLSVVGSVYALLKLFCGELRKIRRQDLGGYALVVQPRDAV